jgi:hypothetical protein
MIGVFMMTGCENDTPDSIYDPNEEGLPAPVIQNMVAEPTDNGSALAGLSEITITGQNFSSIPENNLVYFNDSQAEVLSASNTQIVIKTPPTVGDSIRVRITVAGSEFFADLIYYKVVPAVQEIGLFKEDDLGLLLAADGNENLFLGLRSKMIKKVDPTYATTEYFIKPYLNGNSMRYYAEKDALLFSIAFGRVKYITTFLPDGTEGEKYTFRSEPTGFDFGPDGNIWVAVGQSLYQLNPADGSDEEILDVGVDIEKVRVFNGYVYFSNSDNVEQTATIWKAEIQDGSLAAPEEVLALTASDWLEGYAINDFTFAQDGTLYLVSDHPEYGLWRYNETDGSHGTVYENLLSADFLGAEFQSMDALTWGNDRFLYVVQILNTAGVETMKLWKVNMLKSGAIYYGR